jgi:TRAP-type transport system small permease protein
MRVVDRLARVLVAILAPLSALTLLALLMLMVADVTGRFVFNRPIRGAYEITEFLMCVLILGALPLVGLWRRHVEASLIADAAPALTPFLHWLAGVLTVGLFGWLAMLMWTYGDQLARQNSHSLFGGIPHAPFAYYIAVLCLVSAVATAIATLRRIPGPDHLDEAGP